jgi:hypothetical protein
MQHVVKRKHRSVDAIKSVGECKNTDKIDGAGCFDPKHEIGTVRERI